MSSSLYPAALDEIIEELMSAFGTKRTWRSHAAMSAFGGKADIGGSKLLLCNLIPETSFRESQIPAVIVDAKTARVHRVSCQRGFGRL